MPQPRLHQSPMTLLARMLSTQQWPTQSTTSRTKRSSWRPNSLAVSISALVALRVPRVSQLISGLSALIAEQSASMTVVEATGVLHALAKMSCGGDAAPAKALVARVVEQKVHCQLVEIYTVLNAVAKLLPCDAAAVTVDLSAVITEKVAKCRNGELLRLLEAIQAVRECGAETELAIPPATLAALALRMKQLLPLAAKDEVLHIYLGLVQNCPESSQGDSVFLARVASEVLSADVDTLMKLGAHSSLLGAQLSTACATRAKTLAATASPEQIVRLLSLYSGGAGVLETAQTRALQLIADSRTTEEEAVSLAWALSGPVPRVAEAALTPVQLAAQKRLASKAENMQLHLLLKALCSGALSLETVARVPHFAQLSVEAADFCVVHEMGVAAAASYYLYRKRHPAWLPLAAAIFKHEMSRWSTKFFPLHHRSRNFQDAYLALHGITAFVVYATSRASEKGERSYTDAGLNAVLESCCHSPTVTCGVTPFASSLLKALPSGATQLSSRALLWYATIVSRVRREPNGADGVLIRDFARAIVSDASRQLTKDAVIRVAVARFMLMSSGFEWPEGHPLISDPSDITSALVILPLESMTKLIFALSLHPETHSIIAPLAEQVCDGRLGLKEEQLLEVLYGLPSGDSECRNVATVLTRHIVRHHAKFTVSLFASCVNCLGKLGLEGTIVFRQVVALVASRSHEMTPSQFFRCIDGVRHARGDALRPALRCKLMERIKALESLLGQQEHPPPSADTNQVVEDLALLVEAASVGYAGDEPLWALAASAFKAFRSRSDSLAPATASLSARLQNAFCDAGASHLLC